MSQSFLTTFIEKDTIMKNLTANANTYGNLSVCLILMWVVGVGMMPMPVEAGTIQRISVNNNGEEANGDSSQPFISDNGRFVAFKSEASNLVEGDTNEVADIFVYDLLEHKIERVSVDSNGNQSNDYSHAPSISADGRYVVFLSNADNLTDIILPDINKYSSIHRNSDVFVHDRENATTQRISSNNKNYKGSVVHTPMISANGKYVVFDANYSPIDKESYQRQQGLFLHDLDSGSTSFIECRYCTDLSISGDGRFIAFDTFAKYIPDVHPNSSLRSDIFVYDRVKDEFIRIAFDNDGNETKHGGSGQKISTNGRYVIFKGSGFVVGEAKTSFFGQDVLVHDLKTKITTKASVDSNGNELLDADFSGLAISGDGRYVILAQYNIVGESILKDSHGDSHGLYIHDMQTNENIPLRIGKFGFDTPSFSGDGRYIAFRASSDIFVYDMGAGSVVSISGKIHSPDNQPLANVSLCLDDIDNCETSTDASGNFTLTRELRNSLYLITPRYTEASGALKFTPKSRWLNVTDKPIENINFIATPYDPNPHIYVSTNAMQFSAENPIIDVDIRMDFEGDEAIEKFYDVYMVIGAVDAPVETMLFHGGQTGFQNTLTPYLENKRITPTDGEWQTIFTYGFDKNVPAGDYFVHIGLMDKDNGELVAEDRVEVNYAPEPKPLYVVEQGVARIPAPKPELSANPEQTIKTELETYLRKKKGDSEGVENVVKLGADTTLDMMIATLDHRGLKMFKKANGILNEISGAGIAYLDYDAAASTGEINTHQRDMLFGVYVLGSLLEKTNLYSVNPKDLADGIKRLFVASNEHKRTLASVAAAGGLSFPSNFKFGHLGFLFRGSERELKVKLNALIIFDEDLETPKQIMNENNLNKMYACQFQVQSKGNKFGVMLPDPGLYLVSAQDQSDFSVRQQTVIIDGGDVSVQFDYGKAGTGEWDYGQVQKCRY
jgi:Tol biopolymer transport system component